MLIEFSVTNFKSIQTTQTLSLPATPATELQVEQNCFTTAEKSVRRLLRSIAI